nr:molybdopterin-dependent oxidoreductase [Bacteroidota bacterium]
MNQHQKDKLYHESAVKHVTGKSVFVNDIPVNDQLLFGKMVYSKMAHANISRIHLSEAKKLYGVHAVLTAGDIPGENQLGPVFHDEPCLADGLVECIGQAVVLIAAKDEDTALAAEKLIRIEYESLEAVLDIETAMQKTLTLGQMQKIESGDVEKIFSVAPHIIDGDLKTGAQEHWYLETQSCLSIPGEDTGMMVHSSTQHPSETQAIVARVLGVHRNAVDVEVKRMGGAFGGKETQANHVAAWSALLANATGRPVKIHFFRDDDQIITGKRHRFLSKYRAAFDDSGMILALDVGLNADGGIAMDLSGAILERAMFHVDNAYFIPNLRVTGQVWKTNLPSNTAFRGFGGPQGMAVIESVMDRIGRNLKKDPSEIRKLNFYGTTENNMTHYGEVIENNRLSLMYDKLLRKSAYAEKRSVVNLFNSNNEFYKKGLALTPVKFGISFTTSFLNQAGALVNIYQDGTVLVNHGGTEMGQGLHTKILGIASKELGVDPKFIKISPTNTSKVPNTSATAASSGSDLNGMAVKNAIDKIKRRLYPVALEIFGNPIAIDAVENGDLIFRKDTVTSRRHPGKQINFKELISEAYLARVSLSATGFYKTPGIHYNRAAGRGHPFHY